MKPVLSIVEIVFAATLACLATPTSAQFNRRQGIKKTNKSYSIANIISKNHEKLTEY